jgi:hypothetical protein
MPTNQTKRYNDFLELNSLSEHQRIISLKAIFDRDITNNKNFLFRTKIIRPLKVDGVITMDVLFKHLTHESVEEKDENGKTFKSRAIFDFHRSKRLHWLWHHIQEKTSGNIDIFSFEDRVKGKNIIRTYIYDFTENYVIVLEPQRSRLDYYLLTAYHATKEKGGIKQIENKSKKRLPEVY